MTEQNCAIILDDETARKIMAKVLTIAIKEATGMVQTSMKRKHEAQEWLQTEWAYDWACVLNNGSELEALCYEIVAGKYPVKTRNGKGNGHA